MVTSVGKVTLILVGIVLCTKVLKHVFNRGHLLAFLVLLLVVAFIDRNPVEKSNIERRHLLWRTLGGILYLDIFGSISELGNINGLVVLLHGLELVLHLTLRSLDAGGLVL